MRQIGSATALKRAHGQHICDILAARSTAKHDRAKASPFIFFFARRERMFAATHSLDAGDLLVASSGDSDSVLVAVPAAGGEPRWAVPRGKQPGQLLNAKYMLLHDGRVYVADWGNDRVLAFEASTGRCVLTVDGIAGPWGLAKLDGHIFVTSGNGHSVLKLTYAGERVHSWGGHGSDEGQFNSPLGITVLDGQLFVADRGNHRLQCFSPDGRFLRMFGSHGHGPTGFNFPYGLAEHERLLYVSDIGHDVRVFTPGGELVGPERRSPEPAPNREPDRARTRTGSRTTRARSSRLVQTTYPYSPYP